MRTEKVGIQNQTSFGQLNIKKGAGLTDKIAEAIEVSPAMKKFGRRYNAEVYYQEFSDKAHKKIYKGLTFDDVHPTNIFFAFWDRLRGIMPEFGNFVHYNSYKTTEAEFAEAIKGLGKNEIFDRYHP